MYEIEEQPASTEDGTMGIDLGVNNLPAVSIDTDAQPVLINADINAGYQMMKKAGAVILL